MSTRTSPPQLNFSAGEISPLLHRRSDYLRRQSGLRTCRGFLPLRQGGFTRAPGTTFRGYTRGNAEARLIDFEFAEDDAVTLEFTDGWMRVWRYGALVMAGSAPYELATPFGSFAIRKLQWVQSADVIYLVANGQHPVYRLARHALDDWSLTVFRPEGGPFRSFNTDETRTVSASADTGSVTLTASWSLFTPEHVGSLILLSPPAWETIPRWTGNTAVAVGQRMRFDGKVYELAAGTNTGANPPEHERGTEQVAIDTAGAPISWTYLCDNIGIARITAVASGTSATAAVVRRLPLAVVDTPTYLWAESAWSDVYGYPTAIEMFQQRLVFAATPSEPRTLWFSAAGGFDDFYPSVEEDGAFTYAIAGESSLNRILCLRRVRGGLHVGALGEEHSTRFLDTDQTVSLTSISFGTDSKIGSAPIRPLAPRGDPMFVSKDRTRLFEIVYSLQEDANRERELSLPAEHLGAGKFAELAFQAAPQRLLWIRRASGDLAVLVYDPAEDVLGWATVPVAGGTVEAMSVTAAATGGADILTLVVRRTVNGQTVRMVEEQALTYGLLSGAQPIAEAVHFFAASVFTPGAATDTFSVPHLAGETVHAWTDVGAYGPLTVAADGTVVLEQPVTRATIGLFDATHMAETLPILAAARDGDTMARRKKLHSGTGVAVHRTAAGQVAVVERELGQPERVHKAQDIVRRQVAADLSTAWSGVAPIDAPSGSAADVSVRILPVGGAPLTVLALVPVVEEQS